jgi:pimeloyl-ACP methyl ester carboxylesterase
MRANRTDDKYGGRGRSAIAGAVRDMRAGTLNAALRAFPGRPGAAIGAGPGHLPVLLVHGYGGSKTDWLRLQRALGRAGFDHVRTFEYDSLTTPIPQLARQLGAAARRLAEAAGTDGVHLIGHSLGGIVVRYAVTVGGLDELVHGAVTIASPHGGCRLALAGIGPAAAQIRPGSAVLRQLEATARPGHARWAAFTSEADLVVPARRARIRPAALGAVNVVIPGEGHLSILQSPRLAARLVEHLCAAESTPVAVAA